MKTQYNKPVNTLLSAIKKYNSTPMSQRSSAVTSSYVLYRFGTYLELCVDLLPEWASDFDSYNYKAIDSNQLRRFYGSRIPKDPKRTNLRVFLNLYDRRDNSVSTVEVLFEAE